MYASKLIPRNFGLVRRLATEVSKGQVIHQIRRNLTTNMYQDKTKPEIVPNAIYIDPTYRCNRRCVGCYVDQRSGIIPVELAEQASDYSLRKGVNYIAWLGGEPLLPKVRDIVIGLTLNFPRMSFNFCTNGDFLDKDLANRISKLDNLVPFVSIDGLKKTHDWRRGKGSYDNAIKAMNLLKDRSRLFGYMSTVMPQNKDVVSSREFVDEMVDSGCMIGGYSLFLCGSVVSSIISPEEYWQFAGKLRDIAREFPLYILSTDFGYMGNGIVYRKSKRLIAVSVGPSGEVRTERGSIPIGNLSVNSLDDIISNESTQKIFKEKIIGTGGAERDPRLGILQNS